MGSRQRSGARRVFNDYRQLIKVLACYDPLDVAGDRFGIGESAETVLCGNLPSRRRADQYLVRFVRDGLPRGLRQTRAIREPPEKRMGVEQ